MKTVINTNSPQAKMATLMEAFAGGSEGQVERQEAQGQVSFCESDTLPVEAPADADEVLRSWGVELGDVVPGDPIWRYAKLPHGWVRKRTDHSMWSTIFDEYARPRLKVFYKAAFYDRSCRLMYVNCLRVEEVGAVYEDDVPGELAVTAGGKVLKSFGGLRKRTEDRRWEHTNTLRDRAHAWLDANFAGWNLPTTFWDMSFEELEQIAGGAS